MSGDIWFVTGVANPCGYHSRYDLYRKFAEHLLTEVKGNLCTVEVAYGGQPHVLEAAALGGHRDAPRGADEEGPPECIYLPLAARSVLWHKENMLNRAIDALPSSAKYVVWVDADLTFRRASQLLGDIRRAHETHPVVQCFSTCLDLGPDGATAMKVHHSLGFSSQHGLPLELVGDGVETFAHTGYVYSATIEFIRHVGGLLDVGVIGSGDRLMAMGCLGRADAAVPRGLAASGYRDAILRWQEKALEVTGGRLGYTRGLIEHHFHGFKRDRQYATRTQVLVKHQFDPRRHLLVNADGIYEFADGCDEFERDMVAYFARRNEDAVTIEPAERSPPAV